MTSDTIIGIASAIPVLILLIGSHGFYNKRRENVFPVAELEKFNKESKES